MATRQQQSRPGYAGALLAVENDPRLVAVPAGGATGQVLTKTAPDSYATAWLPPPAATAGTGTGTSAPDPMILMGAY